ncbi:hypothetical protein EDB83DRAFT_2658862 [Lactarius deliciosus]|nr:hypothetical protein EDB83DRAFT_2658862 [Lactarius deliciosus]
MGHSGALGRGLRGTVCGSNTQVGVVVGLASRDGVASVQVLRRGGVIVVDQQRVDVGPTYSEPRVRGHRGRRPHVAGVGAADVVAIIVAAVIVTGGDLHAASAVVGYYAPCLGCIMTGLAGSRLVWVVAGSCVSRRHGVVAGGAFTRRGGGGGLPYDEGWRWWTRADECEAVAGYSSAKCTHTTCMMFVPSVSKKNEEKPKESAFESLPTATALYDHHLLLIYWPLMPAPPVTSHRQDWLCHDHDEGGGKVTRRRQLGGNDPDRDDHDHDRATSTTAAVAAGGDDPNPNNLNCGGGCAQCAGTTPTTITGTTATVEGGALQ